MAQKMKLVNEMMEYIDWHEVRNHDFPQSSHVNLQELVTVSYRKPFSKIVFSCALG